VLPCVPPAGGGSALHPVALEVAQDDAELQAHGAGGPGAQPNAVAVTGVGGKRLGAPPPPKLAQALPPGPLGPPGDAGQRVAPRGAGDLAGAEAHQLAMPQGALVPHLEVQLGSAWGGRQKGGDRLGTLWGHLGGYLGTLCRHLGGTLGTLWGRTLQALGGVVDVDVVTRYDPVPPSLACSPHLQKRRHCKYI